MLVEIELSFKSPLEISNTQDSDYDAVLIKVLDTNFFMSKEGDPLKVENVDEGVQFTKRLPLQPPSSEAMQQALEAMTAIGKEAGGTSKQVWILKFILDLVLANTLSETLGSFALLQLMLFPLAFNCRYPINVADTSEVAIETASMDVFPVDVFEF